MACRNHTPPQCREEVARTHVSAYICSSVSRVVQKFSFSRERLHIKTRGQRKQARQVDASRNVYVGDTSWNTSSTVWMREGVAGWVGLKEDLTGSWTGASRKRKRTIKSCCRLAGLAVWRSSRTNGHVHRALHGRAGEGTDAFSNLGLSQTSHSSMYATGRKQVGKRSASEGKAAGRADYCFLTRDSNARSDPAAVEIQAMWNLCGVCVCVCLCVCVCGGSGMWHVCDNGNRVAIESERAYFRGGRQREGAGRWETSRGERERGVVSHPRPGRRTSAVGFGAAALLSCLLDVGPVFSGRLLPRSPRDSRRNWAQTRRGRRRRRARRAYFVRHPGRLGTGQNSLDEPTLVPRSRPGAKTR